MWLISFGKSRMVGFIVGPPPPSGRGSSMISMSVVCNIIACKLVASVQSDRASCFAINALLNFVILDSQLLFFDLHSDVSKVLCRWAQYIVWLPRGCPLYFCRFRFFFCTSLLIQKIYKIIYLLPIKILIKLLLWTNFKM